MSTSSFGIFDRGKAVGFHEIVAANFEVRRESGFRVEMVVGSWTCSFIPELVPF